MPKQPPKQPASGAARIRGAARTNKAAVEKRRDRVVELTLAGASRRQVVQMLAKQGILVTVSTVERDLKRRMDEHAASIREQIGQWRARQNMRYERLLTVWWERALGVPENRATGEKAIPPSESALDRVLLLLREQRRLLGVDAPVKSHVEMDVTQNIRRVEVQLQMIRTLANGEVVDQEGAPGDPRVMSFPEGAPTYDETGWLEPGGGDPKKLTDSAGKGDVEIEDADTKQSLAGLFVER